MSNRNKPVLCEDLFYGSLKRVRTLPSAGRHLLSRSMHRLHQAYLTVPERGLSGAPNMRWPGQSYLQQLG